MWIFFAFIPAIVDAYANIADGHLSNTRFKDPWVLIFYLGIFELLFDPFVLFFGTPAILPLHTIALLGVITFLDFLYIIFYLKALREADTSIIAALFSLGKITVPLLAFFIIGEHLPWSQYLGFLAIVVTATALTASRSKGKIRFNKAFLLMFTSSLIHALQGVLYKLALEEVDWVTGFLYTIPFAIVIYLCIFIIKRRTIIQHLGSAQREWRTLLLQSGIAFISNVTGTIAISLAPITLVKAVFATQPFFVLLYTPILKRYSHFRLREQMDHDHLLKKIVCFIVIFLALMLLIP
ncbi:MAG: hypothetical protein RL141_1109 [Candidatus Parcubacteria bacterium]|jgi:drug/metabolite transporter (DMT)-like permease